MAIRQKQKYCPVCGRYTLHAKEMFSDGMGCLLTLLTGGLFLLLWIPLGIIQSLSPYRCQSCGAKN